MVSQSITWNDGSTDVIEVQAASWNGSQPVFIKTGENFGATRAKTIIFYSGTSTKTAAVAVSQSPYTLEATPIQMKWADTEDDARMIRLITNGTQLSNFQAVLMGNDADKFTLGTPSPVLNKDGEYEISITPVGVNSTFDDFTATIHITAGVNEFIGINIELVHSAVQIVSETYSKFKGVFVISPNSGVLAASGGQFTFTLQGVQATRTTTFSSGKVTVDTDIAYPNWDSTTWYANIRLGNPTRAQATNLISSTAQGAITFNLAVSTLGTTPYTPTNSIYYITLWPQGMSQTDGTEIQYTWAGTIEANTVTITYGDIEILNTPSWEMKDGVAVITAAAQTVVLNLGCKKISTWTSGSVSTEDVAVAGDGTDSGIQNENIPQTNSAEEGYPLTGWTSGSLQWPVVFNGRNTTQVTINVGANVYYDRTFEGKWKVG